MAVKSTSQVTALTARRVRTPNRIVGPDDLFDMLHGRNLVVAGRTWRIEVYSIRDRAGLRWVQLALDGVPRHILALRLATGDGLRPAIRALSAWILSPSSATGILRVASASSLRLNKGAESQFHSDQCHPSR